MRAAFYEDPCCRLYQGDCLDVLREMEAGSVHTCVTSPPYYGLRDYGVAGQIGMEATPEEYVARLVEVFHELRRVLRPDGTLWLNMGDSYAGSNKGFMADGSVAAGGKQATNRGTTAIREEIVRGKRLERGNGRWGGGNLPVFEGLKPKDLIGIPWMVAFALRADGWWLRSDIIWAKPNPMPESVEDRPTRSHEYLFLLALTERYFYDYQAIREPAAYSVDERVGRALVDHKRMPTKQLNGIRPRATDKQRGHGRVHAGFNDRWDAMTKEEQGALGSNKRSVWTIATRPYPEAHFATYPEDLVEPCILAGCPEEGMVLDPFTGSGTTLAVAKRLGRRGVGIELSEAYCGLARKRIEAETARLL